MPRVPKWMANAMEKLFSGSYHNVTITQIETITSDLRKIRFEGDFSTIKNEFKAGNIIEFRVSDQDFRHYTPSFFDQKKGICEVLFYLHNKGIGSKWISELTENKHVKLLGPGGKTNYKDDAKVHFIFGDETSVGLFTILKAEAKKKNHPYFILAEFDEEHKNWGDLLDIDLTVVNKKNLTASEEIITAFFDKWKESVTDASFYLTGNAKSIQQILKIIKEKGIRKDQIQTEPYWAEGKRGL